MNAEPGVGNDEEGLEAERQVASMQDQLSKEVALWSKESRPQSNETVIAPAPPATQRPSPRPVGEARKISAQRVSGQPPDARSKPFRMSYGGITQAEYTQYLRHHGSR